MNITPVLLLILEGFGYREDSDSNAILAARKPNWDKLWHDYPHTLINASEKFVGLPSSQMGNSEVGHLNIGAGRVVYQDLSRVDVDIEDGSFFNNPALSSAVELAKKTAVHCTSWGYSLRAVCTATRTIFSPCWKWLLATA